MDLQQDCMLFPLKLFTSFMWQEVIKMTDKFEMANPKSAGFSGVPQYKAAKGNSREHQGNPTTLRPSTPLTSSCRIPYLTLAELMMKASTSWSWRRTLRRGNRT